MVRDALALRWKSPNLQKNGSSGNEQVAVDIYGLDDAGNLVGIQCKRTKDPLSFKEVKDLAEEAEKFEPPLTMFYIATSCDNSAKLQKEVRQYSSERTDKGLFSVSIIFWEEIIEDISKSPETIKKYYPNFTLPKLHIVSQERLLAALDLGYYGNYLWERIELTFSEFGWLSNSDPESVHVIIQLVEQRSKQLLLPADAEAIRLNLAEVVRLVDDSLKDSEENWALVKTLCERVATQLNASTSISIEESSMLNIGRRLGAIGECLDSEVPTNTSEEIRRQLCAMLPAESHAVIDARIERANASPSRYGFEWAPKIYNFLKQEIGIANFG